MILAAETFWYAGRTAPSLKFAALIIALLALSIVGWPSFTLRAHLLLNGCFAVLCASYFVLAAMRLPGLLKIDFALNAEELLPYFLKWTIFLFACATFVNILRITVDKLR